MKTCFYVVISKKKSIFAHGYNIMGVLTYACMLFGFYNGYCTER